MKFISLKKQNFTNQIGKILLKIRYNKYVLYSKKFGIKMLFGYVAGMGEKIFSF